ILQRLHEAGVPQRLSHSAFARLFQSAETILEGCCPLAVEHLQAHNPAGAEVPGLVESRHRSGNCLAQEGVAFGNVDAEVGDVGSEEIEKSHESWSQQG